MFKEEEEAIKVDLHEGCGRTKLFWLMALADSKTMKAMVEFREHTGNIATEHTTVLFLDYDFILYFYPDMSYFFVQVNQPPAAQMPAGSVVRGMEQSCRQWAVSAQTQTARY